MSTRTSRLRSKTATSRARSSQQRPSLDSEISTRALTVTNPANASVYRQDAGDSSNNKEESSLQQQRRRRPLPSSDLDDPGLRAAFEAKHAIDDMISRSRIIDPDLEAEVALLGLDEIVYSRLLGRGGFSDVCQVTSIDLAPALALSLPQRANRRSLCCASIDEQGGFDDGSIPDDPGRGQQQHQVRRFVSSTTGGPSRPRYAIKFLSDRTCAGNDQDLHAMAAADMAREAKFLANLRHPNIIKIRGVCAEGVDGFRSNRYFLLLDLLGDTLSTRLRQWREELNVRWLDSVRPTLKNKERRKESFATRLKVAYDIAGALKYLHDRDIVYLDLKPDNLGFDCRGDVKMFDFGFATELLPEERCPDGRYEVNGAGSLRYMAPEVSLGEPFNLTADVYSFGVLLWEILALKRPYSKMRTQEDYSNLVVGMNYRPKVKTKGLEWTDSIQKLLNNSWSLDFRDRPSMDDIYNVLKLEVCKARKTDGRVLDDMRHDKRRSTYVFRKQSSSFVSTFINKRMSSGPLFSR